MSCLAWNVILDYLGGGGGGGGAETGAVAAAAKAGGEEGPARGSAGEADFLRGVECVPVSAGEENSIVTAVRVWWRIGGAFLGPILP